MKIIIFKSKKELYMEKKFFEEKVDLSPIMKKKIALSSLAPNYLLNISVKNM